MNPIKTLQNGDTLQNGKYQIEGILGQGGFGITYKATWHTKVQGPLGEIDADVPCAIKELFLSAQNTFCTRSQSDRTVIPNFDKEKFDEFKQKFIEEAHTLSKFQKVKGIVQVLGTFEENGTVYFIMEFIAGQSLKGLVDSKGPLTETQAIGIVSSLLETLMVVHSKNVLHRDINPNNILMNLQNTPVLIDFGIAREYEEDVTKTQTTFRTIGYSAPEQAVLKAKRGAYTDTYSVGGTLYFLLTGQRPQSSDEIDLDGFQSAKDLMPSVSDQTNDAIIKAIKKRPAERFQSAQEFIAALTNGNFAKVPNSPDKADEKTIVETSATANFAKVQNFGKVPNSPSKADEKTIVETNTNANFAKVQNFGKVSDNLDKEIESSKKRKRLIYLSIAAIAIIALFFSMFNFGPTAEERAIETARMDSIKADSIKMVQQDSIAAVAQKAKADSIAYANNAELQAKDDKAWKDAKKQADKPAYEAYLTAYAQGKHRDEAQKAIASLKDFDGKTGTFTDSRDGHTYKWVRIGKQIWMAENLAYKASSGCWAYENKQSNVNKYGYLYDWATAKKVAPEGWHLPSDGEWETLAKYVNSVKGSFSKSDDDWKEMGPYLKSTSGWNDYSGKSGNGNDYFGFRGLSAGYRRSDGAFDDVGYNGDWWSSTAKDASDAWERYLHYGNAYWGGGSSNKLYGFSVRVLRD